MWWVLLGHGAAMWTHKGKTVVIFGMDHSQDFSIVFINNFPSLQQQSMSHDAW